MATMDQCEEGLAQKKEYLPGYGELSGLISVDPELQIFRKFERLTARNLLYLQSRLAALERWFDEHDNDELARLKDASTTRLEMYSITERNRDWEGIQRLAREGSAEKASDNARYAARYMEKIEELAKLTAEYQDALIRQHACLSLVQPNKHTIKYLRDWWEQRTPFMTSQDRQTLQKTDDLVSLQAPRDPDRLSRMLRDNMGFFFGWFYRKQEIFPASWPPLYRFKESQVERLTAFISVVFAVALLVVSIYVLDFVTAPNIKIGLLAVFVFVFGLSTGLLSNCKRTELFAATATYAAVLVVFIGGNLNSQTSTGRVL